MSKEKDRANHFAVLKSRADRATTGLKGSVALSRNSSLLQALNHKIKLYSIWHEANLTLTVTVIDECVYTSGSKNLNGTAHSFYLFQA